MRNLLATLLLFIVCAGCLDAAPAQVIIIRHAEKPHTGNSLSLSTKGKERAEALVPFFMETNEFLTYGTPVAIYAMKPSKADPSERSIETVKPLAQVLKLTIKQNHDRNDYKQLVNEILNDPTYHGRLVLISWDHTVIPDIARAFKAFQAPGRWQPEIFDRVWLLNFAPDGKVTFQNIPQRLMYGDSSV